MYDSEKEKEVFSEAITKAGDGTVAKTYQTDVELYERKNDSLPGEAPELKKVKNGKIKVNDPLKFGSYALYQLTYKEGELDRMVFQLIEKDSGNPSAKWQSTSWSRNRNMILVTVTKFI